MNNFVEIWQIILHQMQQQEWSPGDWQENVLEDLVPSFLDNILLPFNIQKQPCEFHLSVVSVTRHINLLDKISPQIFNVTNVNFYKQ